jgi:hypothetical protein
VKDLRSGARATEEGAEQNVHARWPWAGFPSWAEKGGFGPGAGNVPFLYSFSFLFLFPIEFSFKFEFELSISNKMHNWNPA